MEDRLSPVLADLLPNTFRDVLALDLVDIVLALSEELHSLIAEINDSILHPRE